MVSTLIILLLVLCCNGEENQYGTCNMTQHGDLKKNEYNLIVECDGERYTLTGCEVAHIPKYCINLNKLIPALKHSKILAAFHEDSLSKISCGAKYGPSCICHSINQFFKQSDYRDIVEYGVETLAPIRMCSESPSNPYDTKEDTRWLSDSSRNGGHKFLALKDDVNLAKCEAKKQLTSTSVKKTNNPASTILAPSNAHLVEPLISVCVLANGTICIDLYNLTRREGCNGWWNRIRRACPNVDGRDETDRQHYLKVIKDTEYIDFGSIKRLRCRRRRYASFEKNKPQKDDFTCAIQTDRRTNVRELRNRSYNRCWETQSLVANYDCYSRLQRTFKRTRQFFTLEDKIKACNAVQSIYDRESYHNIFVFEFLLRIKKCDGGKEVRLADRALKSLDTEMFKQNYEWVADILQAQDVVAVE